MESINDASAGAGAADGSFPPMSQGGNGNDGNIDDGTTQQLQPMSQQYAIQYFGGPVMNGPVNLYFIFYGTWSNEECNLVFNFIREIERTPWFTTTREYGDSRGVGVTGPLSLKLALIDRYSIGRSLHRGNVTDKSYFEPITIPGVANVAGNEVDIADGKYGRDSEKIEQMMKHTNSRLRVTNATVPDILGTNLAMMGNAPAAVERIITATLGYKMLPADPNGMYLVLASPEVASEGFCQTYCGYHRYFIEPYRQKAIKYAYVGNPAMQCPYACGSARGQPGQSLNGNQGIDSMMSTVAHELVETLTDPYLNAWFDGQGNESADKCAFTYGSAVETSMPSDTATSATSATNTSTNTSGSNTSSTNGTGIVTSVCVFCGSKPGTRPEFEAAATRLGELLAENSVGLVYGGGTFGMMGRVAEAVSRSGGSVTGIIPAPLEGTESGKTSFANGTVEVVADMHTRKRRMGELSDAFVTLPGGYGTLEELFEVTTWSQLNIHSKPVVVVNTLGFYDGLKQWIATAKQGGFVVGDLDRIICFVDSPDEVLPAIAAYKFPENRYKLSWGEPSSPQPLSGI
ncbi:hypothetical protein GQ42DRAFT_159344 [Ramicandelaber brevisporus]|nr:hypothetical protein GQ42DRAFT_159344 [Ramicandelaber brevisporus]